VFTSNSGANKIRWISVKSEKKESLSPVLFLHGFGGNADQFRKNIPFIAQNGYDSYGMDLLGYGYSDKPDPKKYKVNEIYNFEVWGDQTINFIRDVIKEPTILVANSVGGVVALQAAYACPELIKGVVLIDISLRLLHVRKQSLLIKPIVALIQTVLRETEIGAIFFKQVD
jgi:pimeloyl-ACP methyl ester carboxylesterase